MQLLKKTFIIILKYMLNFYYKTLSFFRGTNQNKAVFILSREHELQGNMKFVYTELVKQLPNAEIHFIYTENKMNLHLFKELLSISNAKYLVLDDYYLAIYLIKPSKELKVVQLWHAAGAFKKFGYSTLRTKFGPSETYLKLVPIHCNYTHVYVSSKNVIPYYAEAFNMDKSNIFPVGIPRIDFFADTELQDSVKDKIYIKYPELQNSKIINILIAPTYRATGSQKESTFKVVQSLYEILPELKENIRIIYKKHPYTNNEEIQLLKSRMNIVFVEDFELSHLMIISDAFITDYSSAIFDFSLLYKPIAHFIPDNYDYSSNRGLYENIDVISDGVIIKDSKTLVKWINSRYKSEFFDTNRMISYNFDNTNDISKKVVKHFTE